MEQSYKEKYEDILARLERAKNDNDVCDERFCCVIDEIIPELAESDDERVKKRITLCLEECVHSDVIRDYEKDECIAWLEKQGQVKESTISQHEIETCKGNDDSLTNEDEKVRKEIINYFRCQSEEEPTRKEIHDKWIAWIENIPYTIDHEKREGFHLGYKAGLEKQGEQKPVEENKGNVGGISSNWSEEDEEYNGEDYGIDSLYHAQRILEKTLGSVEGYQSDDGILEHKCAISAVKKLYEQNPAWSEEDKGIIEEVVSYLINYSNIVESKEDADRIEYLIDKIQDICPHQKQEWSEEDEQHIDSLLKRLDALCRNKFERTRFAISEDRDWLKSLKERKGGKI